LKRDLIISSQLENINEVRYFLDRIFSEFCLDRNYFNNVFLALSEAVNNAIVHGNSLDRNKNVAVGITLINNQLLIEVVDEGEGFEYEFINDPTSTKNLKKDNGRGIFLIGRLADDVKYKNGGRSVTIKYNLY